LGKREKWLSEKIITQQGRPYKPHVTLEDRLEGPLTASNKWD
jgi:hypothetical protein